MVFSVLKQSFKAKYHKGKSYFLKLLSSIVQEKLTKNYIKKIFRKAIENYRKFLDQEDIKVRIELEIAYF